jgi:hypothetical protein
MLSNGTHGLPAFASRLGMAFDGLVHVNGRWVLMPKPWRAL